MLKIGPDDQMPGDRHCPIDRDAPLTMGAREIHGCRQRPRHALAGLLTRGRSSKTMLLLALEAAGLAHAQSVPPGTYNTTRLFDGTNGTLVGNTTVDVPSTPGAGWAVLVRQGGSVFLDSQLGPILLVGNTQIGHTLQLLHGSTATGVGTGLTIIANGPGESGIYTSASSLTLSDVRVTTSGANSGTIGAYAAGAFAGGTVNLTRAVLTTTGGGTGVIASDSGTQLTLTDSNVSVLGTGSTGGGYGVNAQRGARITMTGGTINTQAGGIGIRSSGLSSGLTSLTASNVAVTTAGSSAYGALAIGATATAQLSNVSIETTGAAGLGYYANTSGALTATDGTVVTRGTNGYGAYARSRGSVTVTRGTITTWGDSGRGLAVGDASTFLTADDVLVTTHGTDALGASAFTGGTLRMTNGSIATGGEGAHGVSSSGATSSASLDGTSVTTGGASAHGVVVSNGGTFTGVNTAVNVSGADASALAVYATANETGTATFSGGSRLASTTAATIAMGSGTGNVQLTDSTVQGSALWLRAGATDALNAAGRRGVTLSAQPPAPIPLPGGDATEPEAALVPDVVSVQSSADPAIASITATRTTITGAAQTDPGSTSSLTLQDASTWKLTGTSNLTNLVLSNSQIQFSPPTGGAFKTLTVVNHSGTGGVIGLNTVLAGDGSPSDKLVIDDGAAGGMTGLRIANAGGAGAVTLANGIQVVDAVNGGSTAATAFALSQRVVAGPYEYQLHRGSTDGTNAQAWYLRSEAPAPPPPAPPPPPSPPEPPPAPAPAPTPAPLYRPEVGAYLSNQRLAGGMFVHSLHDRLGEPQWIEGQSIQAQDAQRRSGWLRVVNKRSDATSADGNFDVDADSTLVQGGGDIARWGVGGDAGRIHMGGMLGYGSASGDATAQFNPARAEGKVEGWSAGLYGTWYQNDADKLGWYADVWGTYGWFNNKVRGDTLPEVKYDANALTLSGETGYAMRVASTDWIAEPQAQLIYVKYDEDDITEPNGTRINGQEGSGWISRLGVRAYRTWVREDGRKLQPYLTLNWWHDKVDNALAFNAVMLKELYPSDRYEAKLGLNADLARGWAAWGNVGYQWGDQSYRSTNVRLGARYTW